MTSNKLSLSDLESRIKNLDTLRQERELTTDEWKLLREYRGQYQHLQRYAIKTQFGKRFNFGRRDYL